MKEKFYITTPIYYASGAPHIGHAFNLIYADIIARSQKSKGKSVFFSAGLDEHGSKVEEKAVLENKPPQEFVDEIAEKYIDCWKKLNIEYDGFIRTTSEEHKKGVYYFFEKLKNAGAIYEGIYEGLYCVGCENFITEKNLINGLCPDHKQLPQKLKEKNYFFALQKYLPTVKEKILNNEINIFPKSRRREIISIIENGISDFSLSREKVKWGIPFPDAQNQTIYVWTEALVNYLTVLDYPDGENFKKFWPADLHFVGADINKFHSIFWPAMLLAADLPLPKNIFAHGLFTINNQKMAKTLGNAIYPIDLINQFGVDGARYLLVSQFSAEEHGDIKKSAFKNKYNSDLANGIGNLFERTLTLIKNAGGVKKTAIDLSIKSAIEKETNNYRLNMENFKLFKALENIFSLIRESDKYINAQKPWSLEKGEELNKILFTVFETLKEIAISLEPFMPEKIKIAKNRLWEIENGIIKEEKLNLFPRIK